MMSPASSRVVTQDERAVTAIPVQVGTLALRYLVLGLLSLDGAAVLMAIAMPVLTLSDRAGFLPLLLMFVLPGYGLELLIMGLLCFRAMRRYQATDLRVARDGVLGQGTDGRTTVVPWTALDPARIQLGATGGWTALVVTPREGDPADLARAHETYHPERGDEPVPAETLERLAAWLRTVASPEAAPGPARPAEVLCCDACGAPAAPVDRDEVPCAYCRHPVAMPMDLRTRLREAQALSATRQGEAAKIRLLLDQPDAVDVNRSLAIWALAATGFLALVIALAIGLGRADRFGTLPAFVLMAAILLSNTAVAARARSLVLRRRVLFGVLEGFAARAPLRAGEPSTCRTCGAPLPDVPGGVLVACAYCHAENILGLGLPGALARADRGADDLDKLLLDREERRAQSRALGRRAWVLAGCAVTVLLLTSGADTRLAGFRRGCEAGRAPDCLAAGRIRAEHDPEILGMGELPPAEATRDFARACRLGLANGCLQAAQRTAITQRELGDLRTGLRLAARGCNLGQAEACELAVGFADYTLRDVSGWHGTRDVAAARRHLEDRCGQGDLASCGVLGHAFAHGASVERDAARAYALLVRACPTRGDGPFCHERYAACRDLQRPGCDTEPGGPHAP